MPIYDCGDPECSSCRRAFGPDRSKAIARYHARGRAYEALDAARTAGATEAEAWEMARKAAAA